MKKFALLLCSFVLFLGSASLGGELQDLQKKAEEAKKEAELLERRHLDFSAREHTPYYIQLDQSGSQKPRPLAVKEYDGQDEIKMNLPAAAEAQNSASAIMQKLRQDAHVEADNGTLRDDFQLKRAYWKASTSANNKLAAGIMPEGKGAKIQLQWKGFRPAQAAGSSDSSR